MPRVSIILPSREEPFLGRTVANVLAQARGDIEVIPVLDGWTPADPLPDDPRVRILGWAEPRGLRPGINAAARLATGEFLFKLDAHCAVSEGFDVALADACGPDEILVPAKHSLNADTWEPFRDPWLYFYLTFPWSPELNYPGLHDKEWGVDVNARYADRQPLDDILTYQGSAWFLPKAHFARIGPMDAEKYYFAQEPQELGLATWLSGGRVRVHKGVWYAHLFKGHSHRRGFPRLKHPWKRAMLASAEHWMAQPGMPKLVERFWPFLEHAPIGPWPADWPDPKYRTERLRQLQMDAELALANQRIEAASAEGVSA